jgi:hypothetical protein
LVLTPDFTAWPRRWQWEENPRKRAGWTGVNLLYLSDSFTCRKNGKILHERNKGWNFDDGSLFLLLFSSMSSIGTKTRWQVCRLA